MAGFSCDGILCRDRFSADPTESAAILRSSQTIFLFSVELGQGDASNQSCVYSFASGMRRKSFALRND